MKNIPELIIAFVLGCMLTYFILPSNTSVQYKNLTEYRVDTIYQTIKKDSLIIKNAKPKLIMMKDSILSTKFKFVIDTIIKHDTISVLYNYPENDLSFKVNFSPDTNQTFQVIVPPEHKEEWWQKPLIFIGGVASGILINEIRK